MCVIKYGGSHSSQTMLTMLFCSLNQEHAYEDFQQTI